jgi:hypothetical protein
MFPEGFARPASSGPRGLPQTNGNPVHRLCDPENCVVLPVRVESYDNHKSLDGWMRREKSKLKFVEYEMCAYLVRQMATHRQTLNIHDGGYIQPLVSDFPFSRIGSRSIQEQHNAFSQPIPNNLAGRAILVKDDLMPA